MKNLDSSFSTMDEVLVKLPDGTFVKRPLSAILGDPAEVNADAAGVPSGLPAVVKTVLPPPAPLRDSGLSQVAERIADSCPLPEPDELLSRRLRTFVSLYLEGRVKAKELEDFLVRSAKIGGVGLDPGVAKNCVGVIAAGARDRSFRAGEKKPSAPSAIPSAPRPFSRPTLLADPVAPTRLRLPEERLVQPRAPSPMTLPPAANPTPSARPIVADILPPSPARPIPATAPARPTPRPAVGSWLGLSKQAALVGPVEEFCFSLSDFRRVAEEVSLRMRLLRQKVESLTSSDDRLQLGVVEQWKRSEVFSLYLEAARESLKRAKPVPEVLGALAAEGHAALTLEEFSAVGQFNRWLGL